MRDQSDKNPRIAYLETDNHALYRLAASSKFQAFKLGGTWHLKRGDLDQWTASRIGNASLDCSETTE